MPLASCPINFKTSLTQNMLKSERRLKISHVYNGSFINIRTWHDHKHLKGVFRRFFKVGRNFRGAMKWVIEKKKRRKEEGKVQLNCEATIWKTNGICLASVRRAIIHRKKPGLVKRSAVARASAGGCLQWNRETEYQHSGTWKTVPGCRHGKLFIGRPCKKRADDLLNL